MSGGLGRARPTAWATAAFPAPAKGPIAAGTDVVPSGTGSATSGFVVDWHSSYGTVRGSHEH